MARYTYTDLSNQTINWVCPFCQRHSTIRSQDYMEKEIEPDLQSSGGPRSARIRFIVCPNVDCRKLSLTVALHEVEYSNDGPNLSRKSTEAIRWELIPSSKAKVFPDYIPRAIILDYQEACLIVNLSPKASATLSRRCLQGMIRDYFGISKTRLVDEINAIKDKVDPLTWDSIDAVRHIGNIGAHMEKDINLIVDVDPDEAEILIGLIEQLFQDWYITRHQREEQKKRILEIKSEKHRQQNKD
jgi:hypothetical protein